MRNPSDWRDILDPDEVILWQGRPDSTFVWHIFHYICLLLGLFVSCFAVIWMLLMIQQGGWTWMLGLVFLVMGLFIMFGMPYGGPYISNRTWYTLTNNRALIATDLPILGRRLRSYPITAETPLVLEERRKTSVFFATRKRRSSEGRSYTTGVGFDRIDDAPHVFELMREIQKTAI